MKNRFKKLFIISAILNCIGMKTVASPGCENESGRERDRQLTKSIDNYLRLLEVRQTSILNRDPDFFTLASVDCGERSCGGNCKGRDGRNKGERSET